MFSKNSDNFLKADREEDNEVRGAVKKETFGIDERLLEAMSQSGSPDI